MRRLLSQMDRRAALGVVIALASAGVLAVGLFTVISALTDNVVSLPSQGSLQEIISGDAPAGDQSQAQPQPGVPSGPPPVRLNIPRLYIDAPIVTLGINAERYPEVPGRPDQVAWYNFSAPPGQSSNAVFAGHVDWQTRSGDPIPGAFYRLRELEIGDAVTVSLEDGAQLQYRVTGNVATVYNDPNVVKAMDPTSRDVITLITCGGTWVADPSEATGGNYSHRIIVRAERVVGLAGGAPVSGG